MKTAEQLIDDQVFTRITTLFAAKRGALAPQSVETLAGDIVELFTRAAAKAPRVGEPVVSEQSLATFCDLLVQPEPAAALQFVETRRSEGVTRQDVYLGYIAPAARLLGERWDQDRLSFYDVTVGTGHLYALMRAMRGEEDVAAWSLDSRRCALFATVPGEDHGIGISVAAAMFRDAGWKIDLLIGEDHDGLIDCIEVTRPQIIGLSLSTERRLDDLVRLVVAARIAAPHAIIGVAPGATLDEDQICSLVDIDLLFRDAGSALNELEQLIQLRGKPRKRHTSALAP